MRAIALLVVHSPDPGRYKHSLGGDPGYTCGSLRPPASATRSGAMQRTSGRSRSRYAIRIVYVLPNGVGAASNVQCRFSLRRPPYPTEIGEFLSRKYCCAAVRHGVRKRITEGQGSFAVEGMRLGAHARRRSGHTYHGRNVQPPSAAGFGDSACVSLKDSSRNVVAIGLGKGLA